MYRIRLILCTKLLLTYLLNRWQAWTLAALVRVHGRTKMDLRLSSRKWELGIIEQKEQRRYGLAVKWRPIENFRRLSPQTISSGRNGVNRGWWFSPV